LLYVGDDRELKHVGAYRRDASPVMLTRSLHRDDLQGVCRPMDAPTTANKTWELTPEAFQQLLTALDPDQEKAAERYEMIRRKLLTFFENRGCLSPDELTDETFDRVARRLAAGAIITAPKPDSYCYGVARHVLQEYWKAPPPPPAAEEGVRNTEQSAPLTKRFGIWKASSPSQIDGQEQSDNGPEIDCQWQCIKALDRDTRELLMQYYQAEDGVKPKEQRALLAQRLGITMNTLRIRISRIRDRLDECVRDCSRGNRAPEMHVGFCHNRLEGVASVCTPRTTMTNASCTICSES
jgi:DNA-directed RNA polymerase specialized sigma24 family protein